MKKYKITIHFETGGEARDEEEAKEMALELFDVDECIKIEEVSKSQHLAK